MKIKPEDLEVSMCYADHQSGGGWSLETPSGIAIFHKPTKLYMKCTKHRSQYRNKAEALDELIKLVEEKELT